MRTRLTASLLHRGMTLVEVVVVIGIISIALPALFSTLIVSTRQQVSISRINEVKSQGDSVLGVMTSRIKNNADKLCISSADHASCGTVVCDTATATPVTIDSFTDKSGTLVRYYLNAESLYESTGGVVKRLTNDRVKVSLLTIQCQKLNDTTRPIISIQYTVLAEAVGNTKAEERATLDYSTKIAVDQIDSVTQNVSEVDPVIIAAVSPTLTPYPTNTPTRIPTPTTPPVSASGGTITDAGGYRTHTFTTSGALAVQSNITAEALIVAGGGGGGYAIPGTNESGGGGGGGGVGSGTVLLTAGTTYTISVGGGGRGGDVSSATLSTSGSNSVVSGGTINETAYGGGRGGDNNASGAQVGGSGGNGGGGAGGWGTQSGGAATKGTSSSTGGATMTYYGFAGSQGPQGNWGGGGGGAGGAGSVGVGGTGYTWSANLATYGAGGSINQATNGDGVAGGVNTGKGGGAGAKGNSGDQSGTSGAAGGSGIVIIRYPYTATTPASPPTSVGDCTKPNTSRTGWIASADSIDPNEVASKTLAENVLDGNRSTFWHTRWSGSAPPQPHRITINMGRSMAVECLKYLPRQYQPTAGTTDNYYQNGRIASYAVYVSSTSSYIVSDRVALGTFTYNSADIDAELIIPLPPKAGQYVTLESSSALNSGPWSSAAEINLIATTEAATSYPVSGHVVDALSSAGIAGVQVEIGYIDASGGTHSSTTNTQTDGTYSVTYVPVGSQYYVRIPYLTGADSQSIGKVGYRTRYTGSKATSPGTPTWWPTVAGQTAPVYEYATGQYAMHHTYWHITDNSGPSRDTTTGDVSYEWQRAGQNDCASVIASVSGQVWNYPAGRCDFRMSQ